MFKVTYYYLIIIITFLLGFMTQKVITYFTGLMWGERVDGLIEKKANSAQLELKLGQSLVITKIDQFKDERLGYPERCHNHCFYF